MVEEKIQATQDYLINHLKVSVIENLEEYIDDMEGYSGMSSDTTLLTKSEDVDRGTGFATGAYMITNNQYDINNSYIEGDSREIDKSVELQNKDSRKFIITKVKSQNSMFEMNKEWAKGKKALIKRSESSQSFKTKTKLG